MAFDPGRTGTAAAGGGAVAGPPGAAVAAASDIGLQILQSILGGGGASSDDRRLARDLAGKERGLTREKLLAELLQQDTATVADNQRRQALLSFFGPRIADRTQRGGQVTDSRRASNEFKKRVAAGGQSIGSATPEQLAELTGRNDLRFQRQNAEAAQRASNVPTQSVQQQTTLGALAEFSPENINLLRRTQRDDQDADPLTGNTPLRGITLEDIQRILEGRSG